MKKEVYFFALVILIIFIITINAGCKQDINSITGKYSYTDSKEQNIKADTEYLGTAAEEDGLHENILPVAVIKVYQQNSSGSYFAVGNPIYFSAADSSDADGDILSFQWQIGNMYIATGEEVSYVFDNPGEYIITLIANDGRDTVTVSKKIYLVELNPGIIVTKSYELTVGIEYVITNNGPGDIEDVICLLPIPQTYQPFQIIKSRKSNYSKTDEIYSNDYNLIARFNLGNISAGESASAYINCDVVLCEYEYKEIKDRLYSYNPADMDLSLYTTGEYYINSESRQIKSIVKTVAGNEIDPVVIAEKLYNYVVNRMTYDEEKLKAGATTYTYATEILQKRRGVCTDYAILYTALCRAAGIPAKFVQGIPVFSVLTEGGGILPYAHAWVEIKLPGYGWIPIDITAESGFMAYNYYLNMETYKGSGAFFKSLSIDGMDYYPTGFYYSWKGNIEPDITKETIYRVSGINKQDISVVSENDFLEEVGYILSEYSAAINHINSVHPENWVFNDPEEIAVEETFLAKLIELSEKLEEVNYPESYAADRNNLIDISHRINLHKEEQLNCMKNNNYDGSMSEYNLFISSLTELFDYYANMIRAFNQKY